MSSSCEQKNLETVHLNVTKHHVSINITSEYPNLPELVLSGRIGHTVGNFRECFMDKTATGNCMTLAFDKAVLNLTHTEFRRGTTSFIGHRYDVTWTVTSQECQDVVDVYDFGDAHWYGCAQIFDQKWPIEQWQRPPEAFIAGDSYQNEYGGVQERYWLSSNGIALLVSRDSPLFVAMNYNNDKRLSFIASHRGPYEQSTENINKVSLRYSIFQSSDLREVHQLVFGSDAFTKPSPLFPDEDMFRYPIWTTWARYKKNINQQSVIEFASEIRKHGFKASQLEIDDDWTPQYGDMIFDVTKFPDPLSMISRLKELNFRVTLWVHPFCSLASAAADLPFWVKGHHEDQIYWWNGLGKCLDVTNTEAVSWFKQSLESLKEKYGVTSFKFDAGELSWLPSDYQTSGEMVSPNEYASRWAELAYELDKDVRCQEVRIGVHSQHLPMFVRMMDKDSHWGYDNGLKSLIPDCLTFGLLGYPFVLPDMVGGNAYNGKSPDKELFIRWLQVNTLMPAIQFSICPWQYDRQVIDIALKMTALHEQFADKFITLGKKYRESGAPIIRPLWWLDPYDEQAQKLDTEFLVGDDLLVAPVLEEGALFRDIYLPRGVWKDEARGTFHQGGRWYEQYPAPLHILPYFTLQLDHNFDIMLTEEVTTSDSLPAEEFEFELKNEVLELCGAEDLFTTGSDPVEQELIRKIKIEKENDRVQLSRHLADIMTNIQ